MTQKSLNERVAQAVFWNTIAFPVKALIKFGAGLVLIWFITREDYGLYQGVVGSVVANIWTYTGLGISAALLKFIPELLTKQGLSQTAKFIGRILLIRLGLLGSVVLLLNLFSAEVIRTFNIGADGLFMLRAASAIIIMRAITDTCSRILAATFRQKTTNSLDIISGLVQPLLVVLFVAPVFGINLGLRGAVYALLIGVTIDMALAVLAAWRTYRKLPVDASVPQHVTDIYPRFARNSVINYIMDLSINITSPDFIALLLLWQNRPETLADIEVAWNQIGIILTYLVMPLNGIYVPMFSEIMSRKEHHRIKNVYGILTRTLMFVTLPAGIGLISIMPAAFTTIGIYPKFVDSVIVGQILVVCLFLESVVVVPHVILLVDERYKIILLSRLIAFLSIPIIWWSVLSGNSIWMALAIGGGRLLSRIILTPYASRFYNFHFPWRFFGRLLIPSFACAAVVLLIEYLVPIAPLPKIQQAFLLVTMMMTGAVVFWFGFRRLGGLEAEDRQRLAQLKYGRVLLKFV